MRECRSPGSPSSGPSAQKRSAVVVSLGAGTAGAVPFSYMPGFGGRDTVRGFLDYRFRDGAWALLNAEYRWEAFSGLDMALFGDWGDVGPTWDAIDFDELKSDYGIGFRFNTYKSVLYRIDIGFGGADGVRYFFKFSKAF